MNDMIEKVARAIARAQFERQYVGPLDNIGACIELDKVWPEFISEAIAAITAMREPTKEMIKAGDAKEPIMATLSSDCSDGLGVWQAMIDRVLEGDDA